MKPHELPKHGDIRPGVYRIVHVASGKFYVGSARNIYARIMNHTSNLRRGLHHVKELQRLFTLDERLEWIFERCEDRAHAYAREQEELNLAFLHEPEKVLNIAKDAMAPKRGLTWITSPEVREKMRLSYQRRLRAGNVIPGEVVSRMMREYWTPERKKARKEAYNSEEYKQLQRTSKAKSMRIVSIGGVEYPGVRAAAEALGIGHMTVIQRLKSKTARFNSWQYKS